MGTHSKPTDRGVGSWTEKSYQVISLRRESAVMRQGDTIAKTYRPDLLPEWQERYGNRDNPLLISSPEELARQKETYDREHAMLKALSTRGTQVTPKLRDVSRESRERLILYFDYLNYPLYQDEFMKVWEDPNLDSASKRKKADELTSEMVDYVIAPFHHRCNEDIAQLVADSRIRREGGKSRVMLKVHRPEERRERLRAYCKSVIINCSSELDGYWKERGVDPNQLNDQELRKYFNHFAHRHSLQQCLEEIETRERKIARAVRKGRSTVVAGDMRPQNIFRTRNPDLVRVFDLDKARLGNQCVDLHHLIDNSHRFPFTADGEAYSLRLAGEYFRQTGATEAELPLRIAGYVACGPLEELRWWAVNSQTHPKDLKQFLGPREPYSSLENGDLRAHLVGQLYPTHLQRLFDYYRFRQGEGWDTVLEKPLLNPPNGTANELSPGNRRDLLSDIRILFSTLEALLKDTGCLRGQPTNLTRAKRIRQIFRER